MYNQQNVNSNVTLAENLTIGSKQFSVSVDETGNVSYSNQSASNSTSSKTSAAYPSKRPSNLFVVFLLLLSLFTPFAYAQAPPTLQFSQNLVANLPSYFHAALPRLEQELCGFIAGQVIRVSLTGNAGYDIAMVELKTFCLEVINTVEALTGVLEAASATGFGLVALEFGNGVACNYLAGHMLLPGQYAEAAHICSVIVADLNPSTGVIHPSAPATSKKTSVPHITTTSASASTTSPPSRSAGPALPTGSTLAANPCVSCQLSLYFLGVQGLAQQCHVASPMGSSNDVSLVICDPSVVGGYSQLCTNLCANPCGVYDVATWIHDAGVGFMANASLPLCSELCPGFKGTGKCFVTPPCNQCGLGASTCLSCNIV
jgi:hypothetical protein